MSGEEGALGCHASGMEGGHVWGIAPVDGLGGSGGRGGRGGRRTRGGAVAIGASRQWDGREWPLQ
jgi:hypothetical protein